MTFTAMITARQPNGEALIPATVYGAWAAHRSLGGVEGQWSITHVPSGMCIPARHTQDLSKAKAIEVARRLDIEIGSKRPRTKTAARVVAIIHAVLLDKELSK